MQVVTTVEGLMGVKPDAPNSRIATLSRLPEDIDWLEVSGIPFGDDTVAVRHDGTTRSTLTNDARHHAVVREARFQGVHEHATVNAVAAPARTVEIDGVTYTVVERPVAPGRA